MNTKRGIISVKGCQNGILEFSAIKSKKKKIVEHSLDAGMGSEVFPGRRNCKSWTEER